MSAFSRIIILSLGGGAAFAGGAQANHFFRPENDGSWDSNWDGRKGQKSTATRHLYLIRHGQYLQNVESRDQKKLTDLGKKQLNETGKYLQSLQSLGFTYTRLTHSTLIRAIESCDIVSKYLPKELEKEVDADLSEGMPWVPSPRRESLLEATDYDRIERAFRTYFHRADPEQTKDSHEVIVCHANVIRYFVCRVLQVPPAAWLRMSLLNGSVTTILIRPTGNVTVSGVGEIGFMPRGMRSVN